MLGHWLANFYYVICNLLWLGVFWTHPQRLLWLLAIGSWLFSSLAVDVAAHRYFSHRSFRTSRPFQFILALWGSCVGQRNVLWWASLHRDHHRYSDTPRDPHTPLRGSDGSFWHAQLMWPTQLRNGLVRWENIADLQKLRVPRQ